MDIGILEPFCIPVWSAVAIAHEDGGPWNHGIVITHCVVNHTNRLYKGQLTMTC